MLDLNYVRENLRQVYEALEKRKASEEAFELLGKFTLADNARRRAIADSEKLNAERNELVPYIRMTLTTISALDLYRSALSVKKPAQTSKLRVLDTSIQVS